MSFENGLNSTLPLAGLATQNPVPNFTASVMDQNANTVANTANTQAQTQTELQRPALVQAQTAAQQANTNLTNWQAASAGLDYSQAQAMIGASKDTVSQLYGPQGSSAIPTPSVASPTPGQVTVPGPNGQPVTQPAPAQTPIPGAGSKTVPTAAPPDGKIPPASQPTADVLEQHIAKNNTTPNGQPNILSDDYLESYKDNMLKHGVRLDTVNNTMATLYKTRAELAKSSAETAASLESARATAQKNDANFAYQVLDVNKVDAPTAHTLAMQHWGIDTSTPAGMALLKSMAAGSEQYGKSVEATKTQAETGLAAANTVKAGQETATSAAQQRKTEQETSQGATTFNEQRATKAAGAAGQASLAGAAIDNADYLLKNREGNDVLTNGTLGYWRQKADPSQSTIYGNIVGGPGAPGSDAQKLTTQLAPIKAALAEISTTVEKEQGTTAPRGSAYLTHTVDNLVAQLDTKLPPDQLRDHIQQARDYLAAAKGGYLSQYVASLDGLKPGQSPPPIANFSNTKTGAAAAAPANKDTSVTALGQTRNDNGVAWTKIKRGPDSDPSNWKRQ